jgi:hypothetical protein
MVMRERAATNPCRLVEIGIDFSAMIPDSKQLQQQLWLGH